MKTKKTKVFAILVLALGLMVCLAKVSEAAPIPMGTGFTYQGRLVEHNIVANGIYDFQFKVFDNPDVKLGKQWGNTIYIKELKIKDGNFTVELDFGSGIFTGEARWLEIGVRPAGTGSFTILSPRQELTPTPYATYAKTAGSAPGGIGGSGTANYITRFIGSTTLGNSVIYQSGSDVGIGTSSPAEKLHVAGDIRLNAGGDIAFADDNTRIHESSDDLFLEADDDIYISADDDINMDGSTLFVDGSANRVGIGTMSPQGKLDVNGSIYQRGSVLHADYVFEPGYRLESIEQHSELMWQDKHLPAVPKMQVGDDGQEIIEIGAHQRGIVEELEKAHIYIEQLHKHIKELKGQNETIEARLVVMEAAVGKLAVRQEGGQR